MIGGEWLVVSEGKEYRNLGADMASDDAPQSPVRSFQDLIVWQKSIDLAGEVYKATREFPKEELFGLTSQMRRAAVSIASNIAEGQGRSTRGEFLQFLGHARGSLAELKTQVILAARVSLLPAANEKLLLTSCDDVARLLGALRKSLTLPKKSDPLN